MELEIQKFLRAGGTVKELEENLFLHVKTHKEYPHLHLFKYSQFKSPMREQIVREARGLILDASNNWKVVCYPFKKFFNCGEGFVDKFELSSAKVYDKLDGSLCTLYFYNGKWELATSGIPDASGPISEDAPNDTFKTIFWKIWEAKKYRMPSDTNCCYMFEMLSPYNKIVCQYEYPTIALIGARDLQTLEEYESDAIAEEHRWEYPHSYSIPNFATLLGLTHAIDPIKREGFVVRSSFKESGCFLRYKMKSPGYVALSLLAGEVSETKMLDIIRINEISEYLAYFPQHNKMVESIKTTYKNLLAKIAEVYAEIEDIVEQKDFAKEALLYPFSGVLFALRKDKGIILEEYMNDIPAEKIVDWFKS